MTVPSFQQSLQRFRARLSDDQKRDFGMTNIEEVKATIGDIQDRIGPKIRNLARLKGFLEGMKQVEELVTIFLNGPIKLVLLMASAHTKTLEVLLDTYEDIGAFVEGIRQLDRLFRSYSGARQVLEGYFDDILRFHQVALEELTRPGWKKLADCLWPQIKKRFDPILKSLRGRKALLSEGKLAAAIEEIQDSRHATLEKLQKTDTLLRKSFDKIKESQTKLHSDLLDALLRDKGSIFAKLDPPDYQADHHSASTQRQEDNSGSWILQDPRFKNWVSGNQRDGAVLYVNGMPGCGKTTLTSTVVDYLKSKREILDGTIAYFYFSHRDGKGTVKPMGTTLRALVAQLLDQDSTLLGPLQEKCSSLSKSDVVQEPFLKQISKDCINLPRRCWIVLDGLDQCDEPGAYPSDKLQAIQLIDWFLEQVVLSSLTGTTPVRVLFSAQRDGYIDHKLSSFPSINLDGSESHLTDVRCYISHKAAKIASRFSLDASFESAMAEQIATNAGGMFLYAKVVLDNLLSQDSIAELKEELSSQNFPEGLENAYERVVVRILDRPPPPRRQTAKAIIGWLVCSPRPLRWREIQSKFCITPEKGVCNYERRRLDNGKVLCGSLVEMSPCAYYKDAAAEAFISLVHETARRFPLAMAHAETALFCTQYLTSTPFSTQHTSKNIEHSAQTGYYGLLDYAVTSWEDHARWATAAEIALDDKLTDELQRSAQKLREIETQGSISHDQNIEAVAEQPATESLRLDPDHHIDTLISQGGRHSILSERIALIREAIEEISDTVLSHGNAFADLNGIKRFKCPRIHCHKFTQGFPNKKDRDRHIIEHEKPFKCSVEGCYANTSGYASQGDLNAHTGRLHPVGSTTGDLFSSTRGNKDETIFTAAIKGNLEQVKSFIASGEWVDMTEGLNGALTPLVLAVRNGHANICKYLLEQGAEPYNLQEEHIRASIMPGSWFQIGDKRKTSRTSVQNFQNGSTATCTRRGALFFTKHAAPDVTISRSF
ncbi:hypothetical protein QBC43DRAFT_345576 [Cladorrhinum sp. PSN259]|nr:hypothetical protein QBC43DRAFT_345576 [Cladorrhinum sp. PSN259]